MDERRPERRRRLTPAEEEALRRQRRKQREIEMKKTRKEAIEREKQRKQQKFNGQQSRIVIEMPSKGRTPAEKPAMKSNKRKVKTTPDIINAETNKRVRNMKPTDYADGYYIDEVQVRKEQAKQQRKNRQKKLKKPLTPKQRKIRRILGYIAICASIITIGVILSLTVLFKSEEVIVQGNELYEDSTILQLAEINQGDNIFVATLFGNRDAVVDKLPYVKNAKISFQIPDKIIVKITHDEPYYALKSDGVVYLINDDGRVLEKTDKVKKGLMTVTADSLQKAEVGDYVSYKRSNITKAVQDISDCLQKHNYKGVTAINVRKMSQISITYDDRILIKIGLPEDIDYKIRTAFTIITKKLDPNNTGQIKGVLNVSECNDTKKSYFSEGDIDEKTTVPTIATQETTESETVRSTFFAVSEETEPVNGVETSTEAVE